MKSFWRFAMVAAVASLMFTACDSDSGTSANGNEESTASHSEVILSSSQNQQSSSSNNVDPESPQGDKSSSSVKSSSSSHSEIDSESTSSSSVDPESPQGDKSSSSSVGPQSICNSGKEGWSVEVDGIEYDCLSGVWVAQSSSSAASSSSYFDMTNQFSDKYSYGEFTDPRDGQVYKTVTYAWGLWGVDSVTFFAQNLNYGKMIAGGSAQSDSTKYCYNDDSWYCNNGFGGLYSWSNAMNFPRACDSAGVGTDACPNDFVYTHDNGLQHDDDLPENSNYVQHQGICPSGWHVMSYGEWSFLGSRISDLNSIFHYFGSAVNYGENTYGFSLLLGGGYSYSNNAYAEMASSSGFWQPSEYSEYKDRANLIHMTKNTFSRTYASLKTNGYAIRCVKDY